MKRLHFNQIIMFILIFLFFGFFALQQIIFHDIKEAAFLFFQDMMFLPLEILLVTFILDKILRSREKQEKLDHMNIVVSAFYSELGTDVLRSLNKYISNSNDARTFLDMTPEWENKDFDKAAKAVKDIPFDVNTCVNMLAEIKLLLLNEKMYMLQMFNNPNLLEHDTFTNMLWALYHLSDELENRDELIGLPETDIKHLSGDIVRAYTLLIYEWIFYMKHLKNKYPYLWSLAVRKNPFNEDATIIIR